MAFDEVQFPTTISYGSKGGPGFNTDVVMVDSGHEVRNINWATTRYAYDVSFGIKDIADLRSVQGFFLARRGKAYGFRFKDWIDYEVTNEVLAQSGSKYVQLIKTYTSGSRTYVRNIVKPVAGITMRRGGVSFSAFTLDTTTGILTLTPDTSKTITAITQANPGVVTAVAHGFSTGDEIWIDGVVGMTQVNKTLTTDTPYTITVLSADTFSIGVSTATYTAYSSGGSARKFVQNTETLDWTGTFDVPVRFDTDRLPASLDDFSIGAVEAMPLIETRDIT
jgi:uncharacterized protein (TIGR02217 family)